MLRWVVTSLTFVVFASKSSYFKTAGFLVHTASMDLIVLWHMSWAFGNACWDLQISWSDYLFWKSDIVNSNPAPLLLCQRDCKCHSKPQALKKKKCFLHCVCSDSDENLVLPIFFSASYPKLQSPHSPLSHSKIQLVEVSHDPLNQWGGSRGIMMISERLHHPRCDQGPESYSSKAQGALWINATLLQLLFFHKVSIMNH